MKSTSSTTKAIATPNRRFDAFWMGDMTGMGVTYATRRLAVYIASTSSTGSATARA